MHFKILIIGLGSMGKRRIRNLLALGQKDIVGFDLREDRCKEVSEKYEIKTLASFDEIIKHFNPDCFIISVPPDVHYTYMDYAIKLKIPAFIEASVVDDGFEEIIARSQENGVLLAPSHTLCFHPAIKKIKEIINNNHLGQLSNILYHSGQYLPDWHSYESVKDYYVSKKETGGAREIVPFEFSWIMNVFGFPTTVAGMYKKTIRIDGAENIDDTYNALLDFGGFMMNFTVDVVSRIATRRLIINGEAKQLLWNWDENMIKIFDPVLNTWEEFLYETIEAAGGYNKNLTEQMYIDEMQSFLSAISGKSVFENTLENDHAILKVLYAIEKSYDQQRFISI